MSIAYCIIIPISLFAVQKISKPIEAQTKHSLDNTGSAMSLAADAFTGTLTVKAFGIENELSQKFGENVDDAYRQSVRTTKIEMLLTGVKYAANVIQTMALFLAGSWLGTNGYMTVGNLLAFAALSVYITEGINMMDRLTGNVRWYGAAAQRVLEVLDIPEENSGSMVPQSVFAADTSASGNHIALLFLTTENALFLPVWISPSRGASASPSSVFPGVENLRLSNCSVNSICPKTAILSYSAQRSRTGTMMHCGKISPSLHRNPCFSTAAFMRMWLLAGRELPARTVNVRSAKWGSGILSAHFPMAWMKMWANSALSFPTGSGSGSASRGPWSKAHR